jgi:plastocyanin
MANVDESTYSEEDGNATDDDHPVTWCQRYDGGRSFYTAMGHVEQSYTEANFLQQVLGGLTTTAGVEPSASCGVGGGGDDTTPPVTTAQLNGADPEPTYDGPVEVSLSATDPAGTAEPQTHEVEGEGFSWNPDALEVAAGDTVHWDFNNGGHDICLGAEAPGTVTAGQCAAGDEELGDFVDGDTGGTRTFTEAEAGESFAYYCTYHFPSMTGDLTVTEAGGGTASGVAETSYSLDGAAPVVSENTGGDDPFLTEFTVTEPGQHTVEYFSTDNAGNVEAEKSVSFEIEEEQPGEPELRLQVAPRNARVSVGDRTNFRATVRNVGDARADSLRVCIDAPRRHVKITGAKCVTYKRLNEGASRTTTFTVKTKRRAAGKKVTLAFTARSPDADTERATARLNVRNRR